MDFLFRSAQITANCFGISRVLVDSNIIVNTTAADNFEWFILEGDRHHKYIIFNLACCWSPLFFLFTKYLFQNMRSTTFFTLLNFKKYLWNVSLHIRQNVWNQNYPMTFVHGIFMYIHFRHKSYNWQYRKDSRVCFHICIKICIKFIFLSFCVGLVFKCVR